MVTEVLYTYEYVLYLKEFTNKHEGTRRPLQSRLYTICFEAHLYIAGHMCIVWGGGGMLPRQGAHSANDHFLAYIPSWW